MLLKKTVPLWLMTLCFFTFAGCTTGPIQYLSHRYDTSDDFIAPEKSVVRIEVTSQPYDHIQPWAKKMPASQKGVGVVVGKQQVLVTAQLITDSTYIELEHIKDGGRTTARVIHVDYRANLALLEPLDSSFLDGVSPLPIGDHLRLGDTAAVCLVEDNGMGMCSFGTLRGANIAVYPFTGNFLTYRIKTVLPKITYNHGLPIIKEGFLYGLLMGYDSKNTMLTAVPSPVIKHFLDDLADNNYEGFPLAGFTVTLLEDDQLRRYLQLSDEHEGGYISKIRPESPAALAGMQKGDVLLSINGKEVGKDGKYLDEHYGRLNVQHIITTLSYRGDTADVRIFRDGREQNLHLTFEPVNIDQYPVPPYGFDRPPHYIVIGGLVIVELSKPYMKDFGKDWVRKVSGRLIYNYRHQWDLHKPGEKVVLLSSVIPTRAMIGYTNLQNLIIKKFNNAEVHGLNDVATALKNPRGNFHKIEFYDYPKTIYLDIRTIESEGAFVRQYYGIPSLMRLGEEEEVRK